MRQNQDIVFIVTGFKKAKENEKYISIPYLYIYKWEMGKGEEPKEIKKVKMNNESFESRYYYPQVISKNGKYVYYCTVNNKIE